MSQLISLKNQKEFDAVNRIGKKHVGRFMIAIIATIPISEANSSPSCALIPSSDSDIARTSVSSEPSLSSAGKSLPLMSKADNKRIKNENNIIGRLDYGISTILLGMKVGRKFGNAVIRNKFKRRMRDIIRNYAKTNAGKAFIIIPKSHASKANFSELSHDFNKL